MLTTTGEDHEKASFQKCDCHSFARPRVKWQRARPHEYLGGFLGAAVAGTTDAYSVTCPIGTISAKANVNDAIAVGNQISVQVINPNGRAVTKSAVDNGPPSALATLAGGAGTYLVTVHKNTGVGEGYSVAMDCYDAVGAIAGTQSVTNRYPSPQVST